MTKNITTEDERLHYQVLVRDIRESKADQWRISNYGLLAQAAAASVFSSVRTNASCGDACWWNLGFFAISVFICFIAIFLIWQAWGRIKNIREQTEQYPPPYNTQEKPSSRRDWPIMGLFLGAQVIGSIMSGIYIFFGT